MRAWTMVTQKTPVFKVADIIKDELKLPAVDVLGIYDVVVELNADDIDGLNRLIHLIEMIPAVAGTTTYLVTDEKTKPIMVGKPFAYILVDTVPPEVKSVRDKIFKLEEVQKADIVWGPYDIIAEVSVSTLEQLIGALGKVYGIPGLVKTVTLVAFP